MKVGYIFPGQGAQFAGMGQDLYAHFAEAKQVYDRANELLGFDVKRISFEGPASDLQKTRYAQAAIFVNSIAALKVFEAKYKPAGETIAAAAGLSLGEATALVAAGAIGLDEGIAFVRDRGLFMDEASIEVPGSMAAAIGMTVAEVEAVCAETGAEVGNLNCPGQIVISGKKAMVEAAVKRCQELGKRAVPLDVSGAFHSTCMNSACRRIEQALTKISVRQPAYPVVSNLTAQEEADPVQIKKNLVDQMNHRTLWEDSCRRMIAMGITKFYELGPGKVLKGLMRKIDSSVTVVSLGTAEDFRTLESGGAHAAQK